jgi:large subunit ribosomal protein L24
MIKKSRKIQITSGKYKGKISTIKKNIRKKNMIIINEVNIVKKHVKANRINNRGKIIKKEMPINRSNIKYL